MTDYELLETRLMRGNARYSFNAEFKEEDHPRGEDGKFGTGGDGAEGKDTAKKITKKPSEQFTGFIKDWINVDLSENVEETKKRGVVALYTKGLDRNTLADISRYSRQFKKYKIAEGGAGRLDIIFPSSKFWDSYSFDWVPGR